MNDWLSHHGIKGQRWGVRRYQNTDGSLTKQGKTRRVARDRIVRAERTRSDVDKIVNSLSNAQKTALEAENGYLSMEQGEYLVKRFMETHGDTPIAFFDVLTSGKDPKTGKENVHVSLAVNSEFQGKGEGKRIATTGTEWLKKNRKRFQTIDWGAHVDNEGSRHLAEELGYIFVPTESNDKWAMYYLPQIEELDHMKI